ALPLRGRPGRRDQERLQGQLRLEDQQREPVRQVRVLSAGRRRRFRRETPTSETVYIVDDDANFSRGLARLVRAAGWSVETFASATEFLAADGKGAQGLGCVLLDVRMPGMRGPELYRTMLDRKMD